MRHWPSRLLTVFLVLAVATLGRVARAATPVVESSRTELELGRDGSAVVRHALVLVAQGAPLREFSLDGVDEDARLSGAATLTRLDDAPDRGAPIALDARVFEGRIHVSVPAGERARGRRFSLSLAYTSELRERGLLKASASGGDAELAWLGPRFADGVDAVTLVVRTPSALTPPRAAPDAQGTDGEQNFGAVMSTLRRSSEHDELELVRAHVARGEAVTWRVLLDEALLGPAPSSTAARQTRPSERTGPRQHTASALSRHWPVCLALGLLLAGLVRVKRRYVEAAAALRHCRARPLIRVPWRAPLAGVALGGALAASLGSASPLVAAALFLAAIALSAHRPPDATPELRGPGAWRTLDASAFERVPAPSLPGAWLDASRPQGVAALVVALSAVGGLASHRFATSPYQGTWALLAGSVLLSIFCTGRAAELPVDMLDQSRRFLGSLQRRLARERDLVVTPLGRFAAAGDTLDELRLAVAPSRPVPGLLGLEVGLELHAGLAGFRTSPVVVVRAADGSACQRALPRGLTWTRGRTGDERACLVRPRLPSVAQSVSLLRELLAEMAEPSAVTSPAARKNAASSSGKGLSTAKPRTRSSPAHAT